MQRTSIFKGLYQHNKKHAGNPRVLSIYFINYTYYITLNNDMKERVKCMKSAFVKCRRFAELLHLKTI